MGKTKPNTTKSHNRQSEKNVLQHKLNTKKLKPGFVAFYDTRPGKEVEGSILKGKVE